MQRRRRGIGIIVNCYYGGHSFCPRENPFSWTNVARGRRQRRLLSLCPLRESRVVSRISWPRERNMRSRLKSETRRTGTNLVAHFGLIHRACDAGCDRQTNLIHITRQERKRYSVKSGRREGIRYI